jgi:aminoglycoside phosphotransferase (APT) family kinase protein
MTGTETEPGGASRYLDTEGLYAALAETLGEPGFWALSPHEPGLGNETLFLVWGDRRFVVRRPPLAGAPADAHDVFREFRLLEALEWTDLPTPHPVLAVEDESVARAPFTVVERLDGKVLRHGEPMAYVEGEHRRRVGEGLVDLLADVHAVDVAETGLADAGTGGDTAASPALDRGLEARIREWRERFGAYREQTDRAVPGAGTVGEWLAANVPDDRGRTLVHGDYTLDNLKFTPETPPELVGVLDWERGGLGDPLADLGRLLAFWFETEAEACGLPWEFAPRFTTREGYHSRSGLVERYEATTGRTFTHDRFYRALAMFEAATVFEGYYLRHLTDTSDRAGFGDLETAVPALVERAGRVIDGEEPL